MRNRTDDTEADRRVPYAERIAVTKNLRPAATGLTLYIVLALLILFTAFFAGRITASDTAAILNDEQKSIDNSASAINKKQQGVDNSVSTSNNKQQSVDNSVSTFNNKQQKADDPITSITMPKGGPSAIALIPLSGPSMPMTISFLNADSVRKNITADSAKIVSPSVRSVLSADTVLYEIEPKLPVDSVMLFVRHSQTVADTLGVFSSPPFRAVWNCANVSNQDQIHLQFGYTLYCPDSIVITSPALPHRWALIRKPASPAPPKKSYKIKQLPTSALPTFGVNCDLSKWAGADSGQAGDNAQFKLLWSSATLLFIAEVKDKSVTSGDFIELHLDFNHSRAAFSGANHRSFRFGPRTRVTSFVVELNDSGFTSCDSINALINEDMARKYSLTKDGYIVEAAIPFSLISNLDFPKSKIGFDVTVMNVDGNGRDTSFHSWAGAERFVRYSPGAWGEARIVQAAPALKIVLIFVLIAGGVGIVTFFIHGIINAAKEREQDDAEADMFAQLSESVVSHIEKDHDTEDET